MRYLFSVLFYLFGALPSWGGEWLLSARCPAYFELREERCYLVSLYHQYSSVQNKGLGGTKTGLPKVNDGYRAKEIDLGRYLFVDPILSRDGNRSCASCHDPKFSFSDGYATSVSLSSEKVTRSAPSLWNLAFSPSFFWDARVDSLAEQAKQPIVDHREMGADPVKLVARLESSAYRPLFEQLYGAVSLEHVAQALAAFQSSLISLNSRYDRYSFGDHSALNTTEIKGLNVFRSFVARCAECHTPPLFTNHQVAVIGTPVIPGVERDRGVELIWGERKLRGGFKVPSLRNIAKTAPYMHSGQFKTLDDVVAFYNGGRGHALKENENLLLHWHITSPDLRTDELTALVAFMGALTDETATPVFPKRLPSAQRPIVERLK